MFNSEDLISRLEVPHILKTSLNLIEIKDDKSIQRIMIQKRTEILDYLYAYLV